LMVVVAVIAILAGIAVPNYLKYLKRGHYTRMKSVLEEMKVMAEEYYADHDAYPNGTCNFLGSGAEENACDLGGLRVAVPGRFCVKFVPIDCSGERGYELVISSSILKDSARRGPGLLAYRHCVAGGGTAALVCSDTEVYGLTGNCSGYSCP